jgi:DNA-binding IclR family transcriptional regulator
VSDSVSGVGVLDKAVAILEALRTEPRALADLAVATGLPRATAHRLAVALERHRLIGRDGHGRFELGTRLVDLANSAATGRHRLAEVARPVLVMLRDATGESTQLYVPQDGMRICLLSLESPHSLRTIVPVGGALPMDRGSAGKVLGGDMIAVRRGWAESVEERERGVASVSAPIAVNGEVIAAVSVSGPVERTTRQPGRRYAEAVVEAARAVERALALRPSTDG